MKSAVPLDEGQQAALRDKLAVMTGGTPMLRVEVDPSLIGGLVIQVGDKLYDASVKTQLESLRRRLVEQKVRGLRDRSGSLVQEIGESSGGGQTA